MLLLSRLPLDSIPESPNIPAQIHFQVEGFANGKAIQLVGFMATKIIWPIDELITTGGKFRLKEIRLTIQGCILLCCLIIRIFR